MKLQMKFRDSASFHGFRFKSAILRIPRSRKITGPKISGAPGTLFDGPGFTLNIVIKVILVCFICLNMIWVKIMVPILKSGPQIVTKTGNPAGLLFRRIWYSVGKSGVLGITEYRQGRPLIYTRLINDTPLSCNVASVHH